MAKTVVALYDDLSDAHRAISDLVDSGYRRDDISLVANASNEEYRRYFDEEGRYVARDEDMDMDDVSRQRAAAGELTPAEGAGAGAGIGAAIGGVGGLVIGLGLLAVPGVGPALAAGPLVSALVGAGIGAAAGGLMGALVNSGVPEEQAGYYSEGVRRGGSLVSVSADDAEADRAADIMARHNAVDIESRAESWRETGWTGYDPDAEPYSAEEIASERERYGYRTTGAAATQPRTTEETTGRRYDYTTGAEDTQTETSESLQTSATAGTTRNVDSERTAMSDRDRRDRDEAQRVRQGANEETFEVVEEELTVGKREVERGGARVHTHVDERPVEEDVTLREERVDVERRPVDRPASEGDFDTMREGTMEFRETAEQPVVSKQARVIEEVVVSKDVGQRTETVRDTVRRSDVEVEDLDRGSRSHYDTSFSKSGYEYDQYRPAYRYGQDLAGFEDYQGRDWRDVEPDARQRWEERNPGTWEEFKDAVRHGWNQIRGRA
jgi:uncharacterized protein (TIGR02271 family)